MGNETDKRPRGLEFVQDVGKSVISWAVIAFIGWLIWLGWEVMTLRWDFNWMHGDEITVIRRNKQ